MKLSLGKLVLGLASFKALHAQKWNDPKVDAFISSIKTIDYDSHSRPDYTDKETFDKALDEFKTKSKRYGSKPRRCPKACSEVGADPSKWALYADIARLKACNETLLFDLNTFDTLDSDLAKSGIRVCTGNLEKGSKLKRDEDNHSLEEAPAYEKRLSAAVQYSKKGNAADAQLSNAVISSLSQTSHYIDTKSKGNGASPTIAYSSSGSVLMGLYIGHQVRRQDLHKDLLDKLLDEIKSNGASDSLVVELCDSNAGRGADYIVGIAVSTDGDFTHVQGLTARWAKGECAAGPPMRARSTAWAKVDLAVPDMSKASSKRTRDFSFPQKRADGKCKTRQVVDKDTCTTLAAKCGITPAEFTKYNSYDKSLCSTLDPGQRVCCSDGDLPSFRPKPNSDGSCFVHTTTTVDTCSSLAAAYDLSQKELMDFNKKTWNWIGCEPLWANIKICLSKGDPPMPNEVPEAKCGPVVPGTEKPKPGTDLADLNPCLLNACCNIWGNCGITSEFCTESDSETGAPGTAAPGENGCISNCGTNIVKSSAPSEFRRIGYFEAWNADRPCLNMRADQIPVYQYTHIHFAFPNVTEDFKIDVSGVKDQFNRFKKLKGVKKIISLGGWAFSNEIETVHIIREAVSLKNQGTFRKNIIDFLEEHDLDGIDLDWEYPGATDIEGTPPGDELEGTELAIFMNMLSLEMPDGKSVSFAAPSSYWYLRNYPIEAMAPFVDYVVHMTYDLHGQWDYGNEFTSPGCPTGNCLRSHINLTETFSALSMITKAGMPSNKVAVGVTSYGRSFKMAEEGCYTESCLFTGTRLKSNAAPGRCTGEAGYIANAEIEEVREDSLTTVKGNELLAETIVYDKTEYVSYMTDEQKYARELVYQFYNMGGSSDWAIDLQTWKYDSFFDEDNELEPLEKCEEKSYDSIDDVEKNKADIPHNCIEGHIVGALSKMLDKALDRYDEIMDDGYDWKFEWFEKAVIKQWHENMDDFYNNHIPEFFECYEKRDNEKKSFACPPYSREALGRTIYLDVKDEDKLKKFILKEYDIDWENIHFVDINDQDDSGVGCNLGPCGLHHVKGVPKLIKKPSVPNPKDPIAKALKNLRKLPPMLKQTEKDINVLHALDSNTTAEDVVDGAMLPVFMVQTATEAMDEVADIGEDLKEADRKMIISLIITAILFIIPGVGEALSAITGIATIARIAAIAAEVGGAVHGAIELADNPDDAAAGIFGIVLGFAGVGSALKGTWREAATLRRNHFTNANDLRRMGGTVKTQTDLVDSMVKVCRIRR